MPDASSRRHQGRPVAMLLLTRGATVTYCHSRTADPPAPVRKADVGVATVGRPRPPRSADVKPDLQVALASPRRGPGLPSANGRGIPARRGGRRAPGIFGNAQAAVDRTSTPSSRPGVSLRRGKETRRRP
ncbi:hypothetical protein [Streptomyces sp. AC495_CC817]|uniref:hypothetical protein n=1 Tax=Streptomyces sp. AC495_CC817 TaxID=2823900 RepID=UPI001C265015